uniref:porin n=1 Tax=Herbaspirillum lusitanum TaxID=213312 RepID=UPI00138A2C58
MKLFKQTVSPWKLIAGISGLLTVPVCAHADDSMTIYGIINPGISIFNNISGGRTTIMSDGVIQASRIGFKGSEDLGGGNAAIFQLETGFNSKNGALGQGGLLFGRQALVGITGKDWGSLTVGRQYSFTYDNFVTLINGVTTYNLYAFKMGDADGTAAQRLNNAVKYVSPKLNGFQLGTMHSFGEQAGSLSTQSSDSLGLTYGGEGFKLVSAYTVARDTRPAMSIGTTVFGQSVTQTTFDRIDTAALGAQVQAG